MEIEPTAYEILEVPETATQEQIRTSYKRLQNEYHPDKIPSHLHRLRSDAEERTKTLNAAYERIKTAEKRRLYNEYLMNVRQPQEYRTRATSSADPLIKKANASPPPHAYTDSHRDEKDIFQLRVVPRVFLKTASFLRARPKFLFIVAGALAIILWSEMPLRRSNQGKLLNQPSLYSGVTLKSPRQQSQAQRSRSNSSPKIIDQSAPALDAPTKRQSPELKLSIESTSDQAFAPHHFQGLRLSVEGVTLGQGYTTVFFKVAGVSGGGRLYDVTSINPDAPQLNFLIDDDGNRYKFVEDLTDYDLVDGYKQRDVVEGEVVHFRYRYERLKDTVEGFTVNWWYPSMKVRVSILSTDKTTVLSDH